MLAMTQSDGRYVLASLRPGRYTLHFSACAAGGHYLDQWSGGASSIVLRVRSSIWASVYRAALYIMAAETPKLMNIR